MNSQELIEAINSGNTMEYNFTPDGKPEFWQESKIIDMKLGDVMALLPDRIRIKL